MKSLKGAEGHYNMRAHSHGYSTKVVGEHGFNQPLEASDSKEHIQVDKSSRGFSGNGLAPPQSVLGKFAMSPRAVSQRQQGNRNNGTGPSPAPDYIANARKKYSSKKQVTCN